MIRSLVFVLNGFLIEGLLANFIHVDDTLDPEIVNQNQLFFNRKERFIKFDTKDNELEIELGISIPFIKVPLMAGREVYHDEHESQITINAPGVLVAGLLMLTSFIIIPFLFTNAPAQSFGFQRKDDEGSNYWNVFRNVNEALSRTGIDSSSCVQKSICWIAEKSKRDGRLEESTQASDDTWFGSLVNSWWFKRLAATDTLDSGPGTYGNETCGDRYRQCSLTPERINSFIQMIRPDESTIHR